MVRAYFLSLLSVASLVWGTAGTGSHTTREDDTGGYLAAVFKGDVPSVYFNLAAPDSPSTFQPLNGGNPSLVPTKGTKGARDPYIFRTNTGDKFYVLATDLDIGKTNWAAAQANGSRSIFVWQSSNGVDWSSDDLVELMPPTAGYVWAPSAIWDVEKSSYAVFWSSVVFDEADVSHTGSAQGPYIYYSHTDDFVNFSEPTRWNENEVDTVIDQEIQHIGGQSYIRYLSDTSTVRRVVLDRSDNGLFGDWKRIGVPVDQVREGPASYQDILNPARYYLWEDNYSGPGYECYWTETFEVPYTACEPSLTPTGMRHGAVVRIDGATYAALSKDNAL